MYIESMMAKQRSKDDSKESLNRPTIPMTPTTCTLPLLRHARRKRSSGSLSQAAGEAVAGDAVASIDLRVRRRLHFFLSLTLIMGPLMTKSRPSTPHELPAISQSPARSRWRDRLLNPRSWFRARSSSPAASAASSSVASPSTSRVGGPAPAASLLGGSTTSLPIRGNSRLPVLEAPSQAAIAALSKESPATSTTAVHDPSPTFPLPSLSVSPPEDSPGLSSERTRLRSVFTSPACPTQGPTDDELPSLWKEAVEKYQLSAGVDLSTQEQQPLRSKADINAYIDNQRSKFEKFRSDGPQWLRNCLLPVVAIIEQLCDPVGDSLSDVFPASKVIFLVVGRMIKAASTVHEEFEAVCKAFTEIRTRILIIDLVATSHRILRDESVKILVQIIVIFGEIEKMRNAGRLRAWLKGIMDAQPLSDALADLERLATQQHQLITAVIAKGVDKINEKADIDKIHEWLKFNPSSDKLDSLLNDRNPSTGMWFWGGDTFTAFKMRHIKGLLLYGKAGCGKSTMIAATIAKIRDHCLLQGWEDLVLVHLFDITSRSGTRSSNSLLASLLGQLALQSSRSVAFITQHLAKSARQGYTTTEDKKSLLQSLLRSLRSPLFVLVDALDESDLMDILPILRWLRSLEEISLLVTSRTPYDTEGFFDSQVHIDEEAANSDISAVLDTALSEGGALAQVRHVQAELVREKLLRGAEGNFRWASLLIKDLAHIAGHPAKVLKRLDTRPATLETLYEQCLSSAPAEDQEEVRRLLIWLVYASEPLTLDDFARLQAFTYTDAADAMPIYDDSAVPSSKASIDSVRSTFTSVTGNVIRIAHASVQEFLLSLRRDSPFCINRGDQFALMARTCLAYVAAMVDTPSIDMDSHLATGWVRYFNMADTEHDRVLQRNVIDVLASVAGKPHIQRSLDTALRLAAELGHEPLVGLLLAAGADTEAMGDGGQTALHLAAFAGHLWVCCLLLAGGAHANARQQQDWSCPLHLASWNGHIDVVRLLLDRPEVSIDARAYYDCSAIQYAAQNGHYEVVAFLISRGALAYTRYAHEERTPLAAAAWSGHKDIITLLLDQPNADVDELSLHDWTPLHHAACNGQLEVAALLIERGANVKARERLDERTPLHLAAEHGHRDLTRFLLDQTETSIDDLTNGDWTVLHYAGSEGHLDVATLALSYGARVDARERWEGRTPLHLAAQWGREGVAKLLLDQAGADVNALARNDKTALHHAAAEGHRGITGLLIARGARADAREKSKQLTPLHLAAQGNHEGVAQLLLDDAAVQVDALSRKNWTALHYAAQDGHQGIVALLLARGADIAARTSNGWTPLHMAVWDDFDHSDVVRLLLDSGADIQDRELRHGRTPLHLASASGLVQSIHLLCERGAKKESQDDRGRTPLYYAAYCASEEGVRTLLELGADATTRAYDGTTALDGLRLSKDADKDPSRDKRIRAMLLRAGATVSTAVDTAPTSQSEGG